MGGNTNIGLESSSKFPKLNAIRKNPQANAILRKLSVDQNNRRMVRGRKDAPPSESLIRQVSDQTTQNISDIDNIFQLLPDTELAMQILISSILSPKDMVNVELGFKVDNRVIDGELSGPMLEVIRSYFVETYKIKEHLPSILEEALFKKGSYPLLILPENSIDEIINGDQPVSLEDMAGILTASNEIKPSVGILGSPAQKPNVSWSLESFGTKASMEDKDAFISFQNEELTTILGDKVKVLDNFNVFKMPKVKNKFARSKVLNALGVSLEAKRTKKDNITEEEVYNHFYKNKVYQSKPYVSVKKKGDVEKATVGHPLVIKLPPETTIPVHAPSNPEEHIGYFVLLDQFGNPLNRVAETDYYRDLNVNIKRNNASSALLQAGRQASVGGLTDGMTDLNTAESVRVYADIVEKDLLTRLKNGVYGEGVEVAKPLEVYRVMLARALSNMNTQIVYVPAELVTYFAFKYNIYGVGKTLLDDAKILASLRSMLMFSNTMAAIKNSTGKTGVKIELDPADPDPSTTVEMLMHEFAKHRQTAYPLGASNPLDIIDFLQNAGIDIQVSGNSAYPETTLSAEDYSSSKVNIDTELEENIKRKYFMTLGLSPETVDQSSDVEFATSIVSSNLLLAKRVIIYQDILLPLLKDFIVKYITNSEILWDSLTKIVEEGKRSLSKEDKKLEFGEIVVKFLNSFEVTLPRPDSAKLENQITSFNMYVDALEMAVDAYLGEDGFAIREFDDMEEHIRAVRSAVVSHYKREWLRNNNVLPELMELVLEDENGDPEFDLGEIHGNHLESIGKSIIKLLKKLKRDQKKREKQLEKIENMGEEPEEEEETFGDDSGDPEDELESEENEGGGEVPEEELEGSETPEEEPMEEGGQDESDINEDPSESEDKDTSTQT
ncbi:MAG: hypothetical protein IBX57_00830 [Gammaproteobacteria bacterium]|nr:hypothetical protein [Gammaproteobacteria bacterium]